MKMSVPLCAAIIASGALAGCGDGTSMTSGQTDASRASPAQSYANDSVSESNTKSSTPGKLASANTSIATAANASANAPIDAPSLPTAMSPGVTASVDPTPLVSHPGNFSVFATSTVADNEVQVQPVVHYAPESSDSP